MVYCEGHEAILRLFGNALWCEAEGMAVSPADLSFYLTLSSSNGLCLWQHWAIGTVAAGPVLSTQGSGLSWLPQTDDTCRGAWRLFSCVLEAVPDFS